MNMATSCCKSAIYAIFLFLIIPFCASVNFQYSRFSPGDANSELTLEGDAEISKGAGVIEMVKESLFRVGHVTYNGRIPVWESSDSGRKLADFATQFSFSLTIAGNSTSGDGFSFFLAPFGFKIPPNSGGLYMGLFNSTTGLEDSTHPPQIVTVEFDNVANTNERIDPVYQHVGINENSLSSLKTKPWNASFYNGEVADVWITYNATTRNMSVFWSYGGGPNTSLDALISLDEVLPQWATVGFSASTGSLSQRATLRSWKFSSSLDDVIEGKKGSNWKKIALGVGMSVCGFILIAGAFVVWKKWRGGYFVLQGKNPTEGAELTSIVNSDLEKAAGPRRFSYKDLAFATNNFSDGRKLGEGGFGRVYKGYLVDLDIPIAVKRFSRGSGQGKREYVTEVKIISMLRHRNLVRLIGWCHDQEEFLLVYDFMPNGSLDHHLFGKRNTLDWGQRYKIALGLASSLLYLHEESEQCVIHRDIKSSNVMLDSSFNAKLGDFGLALLVDHGRDPETSRLAGTYGYMAPEYLTSRRASKESDVYSFGIVALEIGTGRKAVEKMEKQSYRVVVEWMWELYGNGEVVSGVDERLKGELEVKQAERLMVVGLWCAHPDAAMRPSIRQASSVLNFEAELPILAPKMPMPVYIPLGFTPSSGSQGPSTNSSSMNMGR